MRIAVIGGDERMIYAARAFAGSGETVFAGGFDDLRDEEGIRCCSFEEAAQKAELIVLPVRPVSDDKLFAPNHSGSLEMRELGALLGDKPVFCGSGDSVKKYVSGAVFDYSAREDYCIRNAVLTAEGAVAAAISVYKDSLFGTNILVTGYGRIGRILSRYLRALGANVTAAVRKDSSAAWARAEGCDVCGFSPDELCVYPLVFNTVPSRIYTSEALGLMSRDTLIIDLASMPGGVDDEQADIKGIRCIHALALPGKTAPVAAGRIIKDTIMNMIKEEIGGKDNIGIRDDRFLLHLRQKYPRDDASGISGL